MNNIISGSYGNQNQYSGITYFKRKANGETSFSKDSNDSSFAMLLDGEDKSCLDMIRDYTDQIFTKIQNGDTETKFQIGSESLTEKEWNQLLEQFDSQEDAIKEAVAEEIDKRKQCRQDFRCRQ